jgi:hypothetical protein
MAKAQGQPQSKCIIHPSLPAYASKQKQNLVLVVPRETETTGKDTHMVTLLLLLVLHAPVTAVSLGN